MSATPSSAQPIIDVECETLDLKYPVFDWVYKNGCIFYMNCKGVFIYQCTDPVIPIKSNAKHMTKTIVKYPQETHPSAFSYIVVPEYKTLSDSYFVFISNQVGTLCRIISLDEINNKFTCKIQAKQKLHRTPITCNGIIDDYLFTCSAKGNVKVFCLKNNNISRYGNTLKIETPIKVLELTKINTDIYVFIASPFHTQVKVYTWHKGTFYSCATICISVNEFPTSIHVDPHTKTAWIGYSQGSLQRWDILAEKITCVMRGLSNRKSIINIKHAPRYIYMLHQDHNIVSRLDRHTMSEYLEITFPEKTCSKLFVDSNKNVVQVLLDNNQFVTCDFTSRTDRMVALLSTQHKRYKKTNKWISDKIMDYNIFKIIGQFI